MVEMFENAIKGSEVGSDLLTTRENNAKTSG